MKTLNLGTRGSALALAQAGPVAGRIKAALPGIEVNTVTYTTTGDRVTDVPLAAFGGKGAFTDEFERLLLNGEIDLAVHSAKDVPAVLPDGFELFPITGRGTPYDVLVYGRGREREELKVFGTSSPRRSMFLRQMFPKGALKTLRGNVPTRLEKLKAGQFDAIVLAAAGLERLNLTEDKDLVFETLPANLMLPAAGQGTVVCEVKKDSEAYALLSPLVPPETALCLKAERTLLRLLNCGCHDPVAAYAVTDGRNLTLEAALERGGRVRRGRGTCPNADWEALCESLRGQLDGR